MGSRSEGSDPSGADSTSSGRLSGGASQLRPQGPAGAEASPPSSAGPWGSRGAKCGGSGLTSRPSLRLTATMVSVIGVRANGGGTRRSHQAASRPARHAVLRGKLRPSARRPPTSPIAHHSGAFRHPSEI